LSFVSGQVYAFAVLAVAHGALLAGNLANRIFFTGATLTQYKAEIAIMVIFLLCLILAPLLVFAPQLSRAKRTGLREYGTLAERYVREFDTKWLRGGAPTGETLIGSADIQSLADSGEQLLGGAGHAHRARHPGRAPAPRGCDPGAHACPWR
jgi:hypothetical protein